MFVIHHYRLIEISHETRQIFLAMISFSHLSYLQYVYVSYY